MINDQLPIEVLITDSRRYAHVVFLLDRDDFLKDMNKLRKKWKIKKLLDKKDYEFWDNFPGFVYIEKNNISLPRFKNKEHENLYQKNKKIVDSGNLEKLMWNLTDLENLGTIKRDELTILYKYEVISSLFELFRFEVAELRKKYKYPPNFDQIIGCAVLFGTVTDDDYSLCEVVMNYPDVEYLPYFEEPKMQINFYPLTKPEEIMKAFEQAKDSLINRYEKQFIGGKHIDHDTAPNIKQSRDWYWRKKLNSFSWAKLHQDIVSKNEVFITVEGSRKAVEKYKQKLQ
jgi:hypothetical protein